MKRSWQLPLDRTHNGIPLANGIQGLMVWGTDALHITIGRAGFWDHRGGNPFLNKTTYREVKSLLQAGDEAGLLSVFGKNTSSGDPARPHQIGGGQLVLPFPAGWKVRAAELDMATGEIVVGVGRKETTAMIRIGQARNQELSWVMLPEDWNPDLRLKPSWDWVSDKLTSVGCCEPVQWQEEGGCGFTQTLPEDDPLTIRVARTQDRILMATHVGPDSETVTCEILRTDMLEAVHQASSDWRNYWEAVPSVKLPDPVLQEQVEFGLYMQACCTPPQGLACTLQGPLMECEGIPPWSNDYHLNINLQMIYTPALATNRADHFQPLLHLLQTWLPDLAKGGTSFFEDPQALMLPHAVDDRCHVVGAFWTGSIDHGCTAWMAMLCMDYVRYSGDLDTLRTLVWPLLNGAWAGYRAMLEEDPDGSLHLPVSVSPEYKGSRMDAWGRDSSFQLAALHAVLRGLRQAAELLGEAQDPEWTAAASRIPLFATGEGHHNDEYPELTHRRIFLWDGQDLEGSHRHHSHLSGLTPFRTLDPAGDHQELIRNSLQWWARRGPGGWSGWCVPWASSLYARCGNPEAAIQWLRIWNEVFTNRGRASLHDANFPGFSTLASPLKRNNDVMQLDGRFGALTAVLDLLVQDWDDEIRVLPSLPLEWKAFSFEGILAPGGFVISATVDDHSIQEVRVLSLRGGSLAIRIGTGDRLTRETEPEEQIVFRLS